MEESCGLMEPSKSETNFIVKYFNLLAIVKCFTCYLEKVFYLFTKHPEKYRLLPSTDFIESIRVREIIIENTEHLLLLVPFQLSRVKLS